jgi:hypothetical protein
LFFEPDPPIVIMVLLASIGFWLLSLRVLNAAAPQIFLTSGWRQGMQAPMMTQLPSMLTEMRR